MLPQENSLVTFFIRVAVSVILVSAVLWAFLAPSLAMVIPVRPAVVLLICLLGLMLLTVSWGLHWKFVAKDLEKKIKERKKIIDWSH